MMNTYQTKAAKLWSTRYSDLIKEARQIYHRIERQTRRRPYVRSAYFRKEKVFLDSFWEHLNQKLPSERRRRLKYFPCGLELIRQSRIAPSTKDNPNKANELLHRFTGTTPDGELFYVQIRQNKKSGHKYLMSIFAP